MSNLELVRQFGYSVDNSLLSRVLELQSPEIFSHPIWEHYLNSQAPACAQIINDLLKAADELSQQGDPRNACQIFFICAFQQKQLGDYPAALDCIKRARALADRQGLSQVSRWAAWGESALCVCQGDYQQAAHHLDWLQNAWRAEDEWILAGVMNRIGYVLEQGEFESELPRVLCECLSHWGESPKSIRAAIRKATSAQSNPPGVHARGWSESIIPPAWRLFWRRLKKFARGELRLAWIEPGSRPGAGSQPECNRQTESPVRESAARRPDVVTPSAPPSPTPAIEKPVSIGRPQAGFPAVLSPVRSEGAAAAPHWEVYCLGTFRIFQNNRLIENWNSKKGQSILKYLVSHHHAAITKDLLMDTFWPDASHESARRNLHQAVYAMRRSLKSGSPHFQHVLYENDCYRLNPALQLWLDSGEFEDHFRRGQRFEQAERMEQAMAEYSISEALYQGDFLTEDPYEEWCQSLRRYLRQSYLFIALRLAGHYLERGEYTAAATLSRRILGMDNCQEAAHQCLMRCYLAQDQRPLAISQYQQCVQTLKRELKMAPSPETEQLYQQITGRQAA